MVDLLTIPGGPDMLKTVACWLATRRMGFALERNFYKAFADWQNTGYFDLDLFLSDLNPNSQDDIQLLNSLRTFLGCSAVVSTKVDYYVNATTGDDQTGDGSAAHPFQTLSFLNSPLFPSYIDTTIRVLITGNVAAATSPTTGISLNQRFGPNGALSFIGTSSPTVVNTSAGAGPFTITAAPEQGAGGTRAYRFTVADNFGVNELYGKFIRFVTGGHAGEVLQIHNNDVNNVWTRIGWNPVPFNIGDTFEVISPTDTITSPIWDIGVEGSRAGANVPRSRFGIFALNLDVSQEATINQGNFVLRAQGVESQISFVALLTTAGQTDHINIYSPLNHRPSYDAGVNTLAANNEISNVDYPTGGGGRSVGMLVFRNEAFSTFDEVSVHTGSQYVSGIDTRSRLAVYGCCDDLNANAAGCIRGYCGASGEWQNNYIYNCATGIDVQSGGSLALNQCYLAGGAGDAVSIVSGTLKLHGSETPTGADYSGYGVRFLQGQARVWAQLDPALISGALNDVWFAGGVGAMAYPAINNEINDGHGSGFAWINAL